MAEGPDLATLADQLNTLARSYQRKDQGLTSPIADASASKGEDFRLHRLPASADSPEAYEQGHEGQVYRVYVQEGLSLAQLKAAVHSRLKSVKSRHENEDLSHPSQGRHAVHVHSAMPTYPSRVGTPLISPSLDASSSESPSPQEQLVRTLQADTSNLAEWSPAGAFRMARQKFKEGDIIPKSAKKSSSSKGTRRTLGL